MTALLQLNLNIHSGCPRADGGSSMEAGLANWSIGLQDSSTTMSSAAATSRRTNHGQTVVENLATHSDVKGPLQHFHILGSNSGSSSTKNRTRASKNSSHEKRSHAESPNDDQFFFSNMLRNLLHQQSLVSNNQRHLSETVFPNCNPDATNKKCRTEKAPSRSASSITDNSGKESKLNSRGTSEFISESELSRKDIKYLHRDSMKNSARHNYSSASTPLDLSSTSASGEQRTTAPTPAPPDLLWWCSASIAPPAGRYVAPQSPLNVLGTPIPPAAPPVQPWDAGLLASVLPAGLQTSVLTSDREDNRYQQHLYHQRLLSRIWRDVPLGELWLRQRLSTPPSVSSTAPSPDHSSNGAAPYSFCPPESFQNAADCNNGLDDRPRNVKRYRSSRRHPYRTIESSLESSSGFCHSEKRASSSCGSRPAGAMRRRHGRPENGRFRTHQLSAFVAPMSGPTIVEAPPSGKRRQESEIFTAQFETAGNLDSRKNGVTNGRGPISVAAPNVHYVMTNLKRIFGSPNHRSESRPSAPVVESDEPCFDLSIDNDDDDHDPLKCNQDGRRCRYVPSSPKWRPPSSPDQCATDGELKEQKNYLEDEVVQTVAPLTQPVHLSPVCKQFSALIGLEIVVDYVQRDTNNICRTKPH